MGKARESEKEHNLKMEDNYRNGRSIRKPYKGVSTLYNGEGSDCRIGIKDDLKKVGAVTDIAESKIWFVCIIKNKFKLKNQKIVWKISSIISYGLLTYFEKIDFIVFMY